MIQLRLMQRDDKTLYFEMKVRSEVKPTVKVMGILEAADAKPQTIAALGGALAETLCEKYADTLDPSTVATAAVVTYRELISENPHIFLGHEAPRAADKEIAAGRVPMKG